MSEDNSTRITCAFLLFLGLAINGCQLRSNLNEYSLIDEAELSKGMAEAACYISRRAWKYGECK